MSATAPLCLRISAALLAFLAAAVLALACAGAALAAIKLGAYSAAPGQPSAMEDPRILDRFSAMVGRTPDILNDYGNVTDPLLTPTKIANVESHGTTPMITWQLFKSGWSGSTITLSDIAAGRYDGNLREAAQLARGLPFEVLIRFAHEMNGDWYPWRPGGEAGNTGTNYVDAWRRIVSVFRAEGASNVRFVWSPNVDYGSYPFAPYFPGDEWVDYVALDGYNWGTGGTGVNRWQSFSEVFSSSYAQLTQLSSRPVMIAETSSSESGGDKAAWIRQSFFAAIPQQFPRIAAVLWFDRDMEQDWRVNSSSAALAAYREVVSSTLYGGPVEVRYSDGGGTGKREKGKKKTIHFLRVTPIVILAASPRSRRRRGKRFHGRIVYRLSDPSAVRIAIARRIKRGRFARRLTVTRRSRAGRSRIPFSRLSRRLRLRVHPETPRVRLASAGPSEARTQGGANSSAIRPTEDAASRRSAAARRARGVFGWTLRPGAYRVTVTALGGERGRSRRDAFRVVKR